MIFLYWYRDLKAQAERIVEVRALEKIKFLQLLINRQTLWMYRNILTEKCITIDLIKYETNVKQQPPLKIRKQTCTMKYNYISNIILYSYQ